MIKGLIVHNPESTVLVDNISAGTLCLPRLKESGKEDIILKKGSTAQITWAEFVKFKSIPNFGHFIKLNDSVVISNGEVRISNTATSLNDDYMIGILVQHISLIKEFIYSLESGDKVLFKEFLISRRDLGIDSEKCVELLEFMTQFEQPKSQNLPEEDVDNDKEIQTDSITPVVKKRSRGRPSK